jgi:phosphinothricin acetyltransferase
MDDLPALTDIYNHYVSNSNATFDVDTFTVEQRATWLAQFNNHRHQCWVACAQQSPKKDDPAHCVAFACTMPFKVKKAYELSVESSIYLHPDYANRGLGSLLYQKLFDELGKTDLHRCYAGIAQPNAASVRLHTKFGFKKVGHYKEVGWKFGQYWDVIWMEKELSST